jgi:hypothetical protein
MALNYVTLTGTLPDAVGAELTATFSGWTPDAADALLIPPVPLTTILETGPNSTVQQPQGTFSLTLLANDNANLPDGTYWQLQISGLAGSDWSQTVVLNHGSGATQDISGLADYVAPAAVTGLMPLPSGAVTQGCVPVATGTGQASAWGAIMLGVSQYAPSNLASYTSTSVNVAAMDTTNMTVSFTAPVTGSVIVSLTANASISTSAAMAVWALLDHTSGNLRGSLMYVAANTSSCIYTARQLITGLTAGTAYQVDWAMASSVSSDTASTYAMSNTTKIAAVSQASPALMEVWSA